MPFITEELYQQYFRKYEKTKSIHLCSWPKVTTETKMADKKTEKAGDDVIEIISKVRQSKAKCQKSLKAEIILFLEKEKIKKFKPFLKDLQAVTNAREIIPGKFDVKFL